MCSGYCITLVEWREKNVKSKLRNLKLCSLEIVGCHSLCVCKQELSSGCWQLSMELLAACFVRLQGEDSMCKALSEYSPNMGLTVLGNRPY